MASVLDRADRIVISTLVHQSGKTSKCGPEKIKELTQDVWKGDYCASVYLSCGEPWDILIGGGCVGEMMLLGHAGPLPAGNGNGTPFILPLQWLGLQFRTQDSRRGTSNFSSYHLLGAGSNCPAPLLSHLSSRRRKQSNPSGSVNGISTSSQGPLEHLYWGSRGKQRGKCPLSFFFWDGLSLITIFSVYSLLFGLPLMYLLILIANCFLLVGGGILSSLV